MRNHKNDPSSSTINFYIKSKDNKVIAIFNIIYKVLFTNNSYICEKYNY
jgi:hypothetical protein